MTETKKSTKKPGEVDVMNVKTGGRNPNEHVEEVIAEANRRIDALLRKAAEIEAQPSGFLGIHTSV